MQDIAFLFRTFFAHKDFLSAAGEIPGTLYTPLHWSVSAVLLIAVILLAVWVGRKGDERLVRRIMLGIWICAIVWEPTKILWESFCGKEISLEVGGVLPFYPCSVFMLALPLCIWGNRTLRFAGCGYLCTVGLLGAAINFFYPVNVLSHYACFSFAGLHTLLYHGSMLFCALLVQVSGYHRYRDAWSAAACFLPSLPLLLWSVPANIINFSPIDSDYMFFKLESFIFAPLGAATPDWLAVILVYAAYLIIHSLPYLPFLLRKKEAPAT
jgi:hypothetical protein